MQRNGAEETQDEPDMPQALRETRAPPRSTPRRTPLTIEGELVAKSTGTISEFRRGDRVFHIKFGNGNVTGVDGNKLTIAFDKAGEKRVVDSFVERI
jgi:DNA helicase-2/ATP-dependent DNA helicase PcrA